MCSPHDLIGLTNYFFVSVPLSICDGKNLREPKFEPDKLLKACSLCFYNAYFYISHHSRIFNQYESKENAGLMCNREQSAFFPSVSL